MPSTFRKPNADGLKRTVAHFDDIIPASQVIQVIERYILEGWRAKLVKNPRLVALAALRVDGPGMPWKWGSTDGRKRSDPTRRYLQSIDRYRAQALLDDPQAKWTIYFEQGEPYIRRVR